MQHVRRHGILGPKVLLTRGSVLSAILIGGIVVLVAGQSAYTQVGEKANKVLVGASAFGDWHNDAPGVRRLITAQDLPEIGKEEQSIAEVVPMPFGARPRVPEGFSAELVASGLAQPRAIRAAPNGDLFVANSSENEVRVYRIPPGSSEPAINEVFATGLHQPYGIAFYPPGPDPQWIHIANSNSVVRFPYKNGDLKTTAKPEGIVECIPATQSMQSSRTLRKTALIEDSSGLSARALPWRLFSNR
jgi:glucose/arabinose dehydrogenase